MPPVFRFAAAALCGLLVSCASPAVSGRRTAGGPVRGTRAVLVHGDAVAPENVPAAVKRAIRAANRINHLPYQYGGGHGRMCYGLDCSGTVSHVLRNSGLMTGSMTSKAFQDYGRPGPGKYITVYARPGHAYMTICGLRLDTTSGGSGHVGPRWHTKPRSAKGFLVRHPTGL